jgi:hypothetical protein
MVKCTKPNVISLTLHININYNMIECDVKRMDRENIVNAEKGSIIQLQCSEIKMKKESSTPH